MYWARGGANFILVKRSSERDLLLFDGDQSPQLVQTGLSGTEGARFESSAALFDGLRPRLLARYSAALRSAV